MRFKLLISSVLLCLVLGANSHAQKYLVVGSYDTLSVDFYLADTLYQQASSGWGFSTSYDLMLFGVPNSPIIPIPDIEGLEYKITKQIPVFNSFSIPESYVIERTELDSLNMSNHFVFALFTGAFLSLILYNLIIYLSVKEHAFVFYVLFLSSFFMVWVALFGYGFAYLWPSLPSWNKLAPFVLIFVQTVFAIEFSIRYLNLENLSPALFRAGRLLEGFLVLSVLGLTVIGQTKIFLYSSFADFFLFSVFAVTSVVYALKNKYRPAYYYIFAFSFLILSSAISIFAELELFQKSQFTQQATQIGSVLMAVTFAVGLAERINILKREKEEKEREIAVKNVEAEYALSALSEKELMLKEIHHRIKNNLQLVQSLLNLQQDALKDEAALTAIKNSKSRIRVMSLVHQELYKTDDLKEIDLQNYLLQLVEYLKKLNGALLYDLETDIKIDSVSITLRLAVPLGLILNEILSNSMEHAFKSNQKDKKIWLHISKNNNKLAIEVGDNGTGFASSNHKENSEEQSLGRSLIEDLIRQLKGSKKISFKNGVVYHIEVPITNE